MAEREPLKTTTVIVELVVNHQPGVSPEQLTMAANRWMSSNSADLADRMGGVIIQQSVTTQKPRSV